MNWDQIEIKWAEMTGRVRAGSQTRQATAKSEPAKAGAATAAQAQAGAADGSADDRASLAVGPAQAE